MASKTVIVFGGCGGLGSVVVKKFKEAVWKVISVDFRASDTADQSIVLKGNPKEDSSNVIKKVKEIEKSGVDAVISVAGGFTMGNIASEGIFDSLDKMWSFNIQSAVSAAHVASHCLKENSLLVLTGASGALSPTPAFVGYGISKAGTHHLVKSLASTDSGLPKGTTVSAILPVMLDTPQNRKDMPNSDFSNWTPLDDVAKELVNWANKKGTPGNGKAIKIQTDKGHTTFIPIDI